MNTQPGGQRVPALPLIALPGTLRDGRSLAEMLQGRGVRVALLGQTGSLDEELDRLAALPSLGPSDAAVWVGHSLGGIVALHLALRHPRRVAALVLLAANARAGQAAGAALRAVGPGAAARPACAGARQARPGVRAGRA